MGARMLRRMLLITGAGVVLAAMAAVMPATATAAPPGPRYTWTAISVPGSVATVPVTVNDQGVVVGSYYDGVVGEVSHGFIEWGGKYITVDDPLEELLVKVNEPEAVPAVVGSNCTVNVAV